MTFVKLQPAVLMSVRALARVLLALVLALATGSVEADIKVAPGKEKERDKERKKDEERRMEKLEALSPEVKPAQVSFVAGRSVDVELDAATAALNGLKFLLREGPQHGTLSAIRPHPTERHKAIVTYTHTGGDEHLLDSFVYACRINDGPFSAPAKVTRIGRRAEPRLEVMKQAMFGRVLPGTEVLAKLVVVNRGIGRFEGNLNWPAPWKGPPRLELGIGESAELAVMVTPERPGVMSEEVLLQEGNPASRVRLWLQCEQPFLVTPGRAQMEYDPVRGLRAVKARISNATKEPITLKLKLPERLKGPAEVEVAASQLKEVELTLAEDDVAGFDGEVQITDGVLYERMTLGASPEPAQIQLVAPASRMVQFGSRNQGEVGKATLVLSNLGGEAAVLAVQAPPPFRVPEEERSLGVAPGGTQRLELEVLSAKPGKFSGKIVISGDGSRIELDAEATFVDPKVAVIAPAKSAKGTAGVPVVAKAGRVSRPKAETVVEDDPKPVAQTPPPDTTAKPPVGPAPASAAASTTMMGKVSRPVAAALAHLSVFGVPIPEEELSKKYGKLEKIQVTKQGREELELQWEKPNPDAPPQSYRVEAAQQVYEPVTKMFFRRWVPFNQVETIVPGDGKDGLRLTGLRPASQYELRFMAVDELGKVSAPSDIYILSTLPPWRLPNWVWLASALVLLGGLLWQARRLYLRRMGLLI